MNASIDQELSLASNLFGRLKPVIRRRIRAAVENPCQETWDNAYSIMIEGRSMLTLWQAVLVVDPTFTQLGPKSWKEGRKWVRTEWTMIPTRETLIKALRYATH